MSTPAMPVAPDMEIAFEARGAVLALGEHHEDVVTLVGPAGTGKSRGVLEYVHFLLTRYPRTRALLLRQTRRSLSESGMVTYEEKVQPFLDGVVWQSTKQRYAYPNGSILAVGGLDKPRKVLSSDWDLIIVQQGEEISESALDACLTRINRPGSLSAIPFNQVILDVNPDAPTHWLRQRINIGTVTELISIHQDNPGLYDIRTHEWTRAGVKYMATLQQLTGVRRERLYLGHWAAAEGMVYEESWQRSANLIDRFAIPRDWPRYLSVDFGFTHPFVCQWWAMDHDGRLYRYREIYMTHKLVEDLAAQILRVSNWGKPDGDPLPYAIICDHDAEERATLERHLGLNTIAARKSVSDGIQAVATRMRPAGDEKPRLFLLADALVERDHALTDSKKPTCTEEEIESYIWNDKARKEEPVKDNDHGCDAMRYMVAQLDLAGTQIDYVDISPWVH